MKNYIKLVGLFSGLLFLTACSNYNVIIKGDDYEAKFDAANDYYESKKYDRCMVLYEQVYQHSPKTDQGEVSYYRLAKSYYLISDYYMSAYYFNAYIQRFPYSEKNEEALFLSALCSVNNSPNWSLDQTETLMAINNVQEFIDKYPQSSLLDSCNHIIDRLRYKLELKDYNKVLLYAKTENYRSAVTAADNFISAFSRSIYYEEIKYLAIINCYQLAKNSIESKKIERMEQTIERYRNFAVEFPNSIYLKELEPLYESLKSEQ